MAIAKERPLPASITVIKGKRLPSALRCCGCWSELESGESSPGNLPSPEADGEQDGPMEAQAAGARGLQQDGAGQATREEDWAWLGGAQEVLSSTEEDLRQPSGASGRR